MAELPFDIAVEIELVAPFANPQLSTRTGQAHRAQQDANVLDCRDDVPELSETLAELRVPGVAHRGTLAVSSRPSGP